MSRQSKPRKKKEKAPIVVEPPKVIQAQPGPRPAFVPGEPVKTFRFNPRGITDDLAKALERISKLEERLKILEEKP